MIWGPDAIYGMVVLAPGLIRVIKDVSESVVYTEGDMVSFSSPSVPQPRFDWTDAGFEFNFK